MASGVFPASRIDAQRRNFKCINDVSTLRNAFTVIVFFCFVCHPREMKDKPISPKIDLNTKMGVT